MRAVLALLLVASVLHTQLAVGCHCQQAFDAESHGADVGDCCNWHCGAADGHRHPADHDGDSAKAGATEHHIPAHPPCDNCPDCKAGDPIGLRMEGASELGGGSLIAVWTPTPAKAVLAWVRHAQYRQSSPACGVRSLLACGMLLRI